MLGSDTRNLSIDERMMSQQKRRKMVTRTPLREGHIVSPDDFVCLQTKSVEGIDAKHMFELKGRQLKCDLEQNSILEWEMI